LLIVRVTTSRPCPSNKDSALGRPGSGELGVRLVDHDDGVAGLLVDRLDHVRPQRGAGGIVRRAEEDDVRLLPVHLRGRTRRGEVEVRRPSTVQP
jgi:hypothetical protein